jgi:hypothetical protein
MFTLPKWENLPGGKPLERAGRIGHTVASSGQRKGRLLEELFSSLRVEILNSPIL